MTPSPGFNGEALMAKLRDLLGKLRSKLRIGKPRAPVVPRREARGHRGVAVGSTKPGEMDLSQENIDKWKPLDHETVSAFVYDGAPLFVHSTNVAMFQYHREAHKLMVEFHNGSAYLYSDISDDDAFYFAQTFSKGGAIWDLLRVRGSRTAHKKPYVRIK